MEAKQKAAAIVRIIVIVHGTVFFIAICQLQLPLSLPMYLPIVIVIYIVILMELPSSILLKSSLTRNRAAAEDVLPVLAYNLSKI